MQSLHGRGQFEVTAPEPHRTLVARIPSDVTIRNAAAIRTAILSAWERGGDSEAVILDLSHVRRLDSSGVGVFMELADRAVKAGVSLSLCCLQESPRRLLERTGLAALFRIESTVEQAMLGLPIQTGA